MNYIELGRAFNTLHRKAQEFIVAACASMNLSYAEYVLLMQILLTEKKSQDELAEILKIDKSMITRVVASLEQKNLILRKFDESDRRFKRIFPTEEAKTQKNFLNEVLKNWMEILGFSDAEEKIVKKIIDAAEIAVNLNVVEVLKKGGVKL